MVKETILRYLKLLYPKSLAKNTGSSWKKFIYNWWCWSNNFIYLLIFFVKIL